ncbi:hypothetical protein [Nesterenkonia suensis]
MAGEITGAAPDVARLVGGVEMRRRCALSTARRLIRGAGGLSMVAYRERPEREMPVLAHGVTAQGQWLAVLPGSEARPGAERTEVRLQIDQMGAPAGVRVQIASLHALGTVRLVTGTETEALIREGLAGPVALAAEVPGARVALVEAETVLLHAREDVEKLSLAEIDAARAFPAGLQEWHALEAVAQLRESTVHQLIQDLVHGARRGILGRPVTVPQEHPRIGSRLELLDVDAEGCMWLLPEGHQVRTVFIAFEQPISDEAQLAAALHQWQSAPSADHSCE